jgi:hypothetical protein
MGRTWCIHEGDEKIIHHLTETQNKMLLSRSRFRHEEDIKMDSEEIWCEVVDCIQLAQHSIQWEQGGCEFSN